MTGCAPAPKWTKEEELQYRLERAEDDLHAKDRQIDTFIADLPSMEIKEGMEEEWGRIVEVNSSDPYSKAVVDMAEKLAKVLQTLGPGDRKEQWYNALFMIDSYGLTGFQVECMESLLRKVWVKGEEFFPRHPSNVILELRE